MMKNEDPWKKQVNDRLEELERSVYDFTKKHDEVYLDIKAIKEQNNIILERQHKSQGKMEKTIHNAIGDVTEPLMDAVNDLSSKPIKISEKQAKNLKEKKSFWKIFNSWR